MTLKKLYFLIILCTIISTGCLKENYETIETNLKNNSSTTHKEPDNDKSKEDNIAKPTEESKNTTSSVKSSEDSSIEVQEGETSLELSENDDTQGLKVYSETVYGGNKAAKLTLSINESKIVFESNWNDGLYVSSSDFDIEDKEIDIYITETGTDISCTTYIYKYDGNKLYEYASFSHFLRNFFYDEHGNIYYSHSEDELKGDDILCINKCFDYRTKKVKDIEDESLNNELNNK